MPELPEVETIVQRFRSQVTGRRIAGFVSRWARQVSPSVAVVRRSIVGREIEQLGRRGKYLLFRLDSGGFLSVHLGMSGRLEWAEDGDTRPAHVRAAWEFEGGGRLLFCDPRKFGRIRYAPDQAGATAELGPEPLERRFTLAVFQERLGRRARLLKPLLLDQSVIAGLGNIYADEALFRAGLHPLARSNRLSVPQVSALYAAIRAALREGIRRQGTSFDWVYAGGGMQAHLRVYGRTGEPCRTCGTPITYLRVAQRGTHICPKCQAQ